jgi:hypothetical protein
VIQICQKQSKYLVLLAVLTDFVVCVLRPLKDIPWIHVPWWHSTAARFVVFPSDRPAVTVTAMLVPRLKHDFALTRFRRVVAFGWFDPCEG